MLKIIGSICILLASGGMAYSYICGLRKELCQTEQLLELLTVIEGELMYHRCPLPELLQHLSSHMPKPYCELLKQGSLRMEDNREADIPALWKEVCMEFAEQLVLPPQADQVLLRIGEVFAYHSLEASLQLLALCKQKLADLLAHRHAEFAGKQKLYYCICYMAGLFAIILLL